MDVCQPKDHCLHMMHKMYQMRDKPGYCDLSIVVEGKIYWAHKCVLIAACPTLHEIVLSEAQNASKENLQLTLQGLTCKGFEALLKYIYTGTAPTRADFQLREDFEKACQALGVHAISYDDVVTNGVMTSTPSVHGKNKKLVIEVITFPMADAELEVNHTNRTETSGNLEDVEVSGTELESIHQDLDLTSNLREDPTYIPDEEDDETGGYQESTFRYDMVTSENDDTIMLQNDDKIDALDISALFSVKKRKRKTDDHVSVEHVAANEKEDPGIQSGKNDEHLGIIRRKQRGRPRLPNDHIFPMKPPYVCPHQSCVKVCESREKLKKHYRNHEEKTHPCDICGRKFLYKKDVIIHRRIHTGEKPYECTTCGMCFTQKCILMNHVQTHAKGQKFSCLSCGKSYTSARSLGVHVREKHSNLKGQKPSCEVCGATFVNDFPYIKQNENGDAYLVCTNCAEADAQELGFSCPSCNKSFALPRSLELHIRETHCDPISGKPICGLCGATYYNDGPYLMHQDNVCSGAYHVCLKCGFKFDRKSLFQSHIQQCSGQYPRLKRRSQTIEFECAICGTRINGRRTAINHVQFTHDIYPVKDTHVIAVTEEETKQVYVKEKAVLVSPKQEGRQKVQIIDFSKIMFEELVNTS